MMERQSSGSLPNFSTRQQFFDFLDGHSVQTADELLHRRTSAALVKTYILETSEQSGETLSIETTFRRAGLDLQAVTDDEEFYKVRSPAGSILGLLERLTDRHPVFYTVLDAGRSDRLVRETVTSSPWLDHAWFAAPFFSALWSWVQSTSQPYRFGKIGFDYTAQYEVLPDDVDNTITQDDTDPERLERLARTSRFMLVDRIWKIAEVLPQFRSYAPLNSITQLRAPGAGRGGNDIFFDGKVTNRSDSFLDHRSNVLFLTRKYQELTTKIEQLLWIAPSSPAVAETGLSGAPFFMEFSQSLGQETFDRWVEALQRRNNRFRVSGFFNRLSPTKYHVVALDRHLWQPISLELTTHHVYGLLPHGTCGNTIHRLLTNLQRMIDPAVKAWIGDDDYSALVDSIFTDNFADA